MSTRLCPLKEAALDANDKLALTTKERNFSFLELDSLTDIWVKKLKSTGVKEGDRIAILLPTCENLISLFFAVWRLKASICPISHRLPLSEINPTLEKLQAHFFIDTNGIQLLGKHPPSLPSSLLLFTSGSTGLPKIALLSLKSLIANGEGALKALEFCVNDRWLLSLPLYHVGGIGILLRAILGRGVIALNDRDPEITHISNVPTQLYRAWPVYKKLKCLLLGGASPGEIPNSLPIFLTYGLTEMGSIALVRKQPPRIGENYYLGNPIEGRELKIAGDGEIWVRGKTLFEGYWSEGELTLPLDPEGWFSTKDLGALDPKEGFAILGRRDWMFISGGENIQPEEIEARLLELPEVIEAIVIPQEDPEYGRRPIAYLRSSDPNLNLDRVKSALSSSLPKFKIPISIKILNELPKKGFKVDRLKLFELSMKNLI